MTLCLPNIAASLLVSPALAAFFLFSLCACPRSGPASAPEPGRELSLALAEIERLRDEKRELSVRVRFLTKELESARAASDTAGSPDGRPDHSEAEILRERLADLESRFSAALASAQSEAQPGPEAIGSLFLGAIRRGDERAIDSLVDWERLLETAILKSDEGGAADLLEFRSLQQKERDEKTRRARAEFLDYLLGSSAPAIPGPAPIGHITIIPLRMRAGNPSEGVWWEVLLEKTGGAWKVTGLTREERRSAENENGGN